jgi:hypothetical protein
MQTPNYLLSPRAESPLIISVGQHPTERYVYQISTRAESPLIISVGQRPTKWSVINLIINY